MARYGHGFAFLLLLTVALLQSVAGARPAELRSKVVPSLGVLLQSDTRLAWGSYCDGPCGSSSFYCTIGNCNCNYPPGPDGSTPPPPDLYIIPPPSPPEEGAGSTPYVPDPAYSPASGQSLGLGAEVSESQVELAQTTPSYNCDAICNCNN